MSTKTIPKKRKKKRRKKHQRRKGYGCDLTTAQWRRLQEFFTQKKDKKKGGRPRKYELKDILNAIFYIVKTGCPWRYLPDGYLYWKTVYTYFKNWKDSGLWQKINDHLRKKARKKVGRNSSPSAAILDSQSVKITSVGGEEIGYDGGKKIKGRKRHILVDTMGFILTVVVHSANIPDREGAIPVLERIKNAYSRLKLIWVDGGYSGILIEMAKGLYNRELEVVSRDGKGFKIVRKRWIVERTFGWLFNYRRHSKDYERLPQTSEAMIYIAMIHLMVRRLG